VYAILDQTFSPADLTQFQTIYNLPVQGIASDVGDHVSNTACVGNPNDCIEANLDVQYIMAVARSVPTIYYYWTGEDVWLDWIIEVADMEDPPDLFTISYGSYEAAFSDGYLEAFDIEAIKLGLVGTTLLAASGDDGVSGFLTRDGTVSCDYYASYPASSPYVTAVGGTMVRAHTFTF
jgi:tripeptidyl-peptidase-1